MTFTAGLETVCAPKIPVARSRCEPRGSLRITSSPVPAARQREPTLRSTVSLEAIDAPVRVVVVAKA